MLDPYVLLDVAESADDQAVTRAYLAKVKQYPPEKSPEMFQQIRTAYESIRSPRDRIKQRVFAIEGLDTSVLVQALLKPGALQRPSQETLQAALAELTHE